MVRHDGTPNLVPLNKRTKAEQKEITSKAGKASGVARRKKKSMQEALQMMLALPVQDQKAIDKIKATLGLDDSDIDNQALMLTSMINQVLKGNVQAATFIRDTSGEKLPDQSVVETNAVPTPLAPIREEDV